MLIRFVSGTIDEDSHLAIGLFHSAYKLKEEWELADYDLARLQDLIVWFNVNLNSPYEFRLRKSWRAREAICWFKDSAHEHLAKAREMSAILDENGLYIRTIKSEKVGYKLFEDDVQVFAQPFADMRRGLLD